VRGSVCVLLGVCVCVSAPSADLTSVACSIGFSLTDDGRYSSVWSVECVLTRSLWSFSLYWIVFCESYCTGTQHLSLFLPSVCVCVCVCMCVCVCVSVSV